MARPADYRSQPEPELNRSATAGARARSALLSPLLRHEGAVAAVTLAHASRRRSLGFKRRNAAIHVVRDRRPGSFAMVSGEGVEDVSSAVARG